MITRLSEQQARERIREKYGHTVPRTMWFLLGIDELPYLRQVDAVEFNIFGPEGAGCEDMRLFQGDTPDLVGQVLLRITHAPELVHELEIEDKTYPLIRVGRKDDEEEPVVWIMNQ